MKTIQALLLLLKKFNLNARFEFREVNLKDGKKEILNINTKIAVVSNSIPPKIFQETSDICSPVLQLNFFNSIKLLGITIDNQLIFDNHISLLRATANRNLPAIAGITYYLTFHQKRM